MSEECKRCGAPREANYPSCYYCGAGAPNPARRAAAKTSSGPAIEILDIGPSKIQVIKVVYDELKIGLANSKMFVEKPLPIVWEMHDRPRAERILKELTAAGALARIV